MNQEEKDNAKKNWSLPDLTELNINTDEKNKIPKPNQKNILITSALPYVNNVPHLGNIIGSTLSGDVFARYCRLRGRNCIYICGTDEYGTATETKALEEGITPKELTDKYFKLHKEVYDWFNISFDQFGRTSTEKQTKICQEIFLKLYKKGMFFEKNVDQLYCCKCSMFLADRYVEGICPLCNYDDARGDQCDKCSKLLNATDLKEPKCKVCKSLPEIRTSKHLFLDLPKIEPKLKEWVENTTNNEDNMWTNTAKVIVNSWLKEGLKPRCITRDLKWGTPVPLEGYENKVFYVWFDAPIGYLSITAALTDDWEKWWKNPDEVELYQFMAKDNVPFHGIIFPSMLLGTEENYTFCKHLSGIEYLNYEETKFSKSRNIGVFGNDAKNTEIPADIWRFYLIFIRPESQDTSFSWFDIMNKNNSELLNNLGNFVNRALVFLVKNFDSTVGQVDLADEDVELIANINKELKEYFELMEKVKLKDAIKNILSIGRLSNQHVQATSVWTLIKGDENDKKRAETIISLCVNIAALLSFLLEPFMPSVARNLKEQLNFNKYILACDHFYQFIPSGHKIGTPTPLFKRIEQKHIDEYKKLFSGQPAKKPKNPKKPKTPKVPKAPKDLEASKDPKAQKDSKNVEQVETKN